jgi:hypothetical protein
MRVNSEELHMRFRFGLALAVVGCAFVVAGCGGGGGSSSGVPSSGGAGAGAVSVQANPTPTPSPSPTPGPLTVSSNQLSFNAVGQVQPFSVNENGYFGTLTVTSPTYPCTGKVNVAPASAAGPNPTFTVTAVAGGACNLTVSDAYGQVTQVAVFVTITNAVVSSTKRH